jgi:hypothetical protein
LDDSLVRVRFSKTAVSHFDVFACLGGVVGGNEGAAVNVNLCCVPDVGGFGVGWLSVWWLVVGDDCRHCLHVPVCDMTGPAAAFHKVVRLAELFPVLRSWDGLEAMTWPDVSDLGQPPKGEADWYVVDGSEDRRSPDGSAVE